jgi:hypothetical protein
MLLSCLTRIEGCRKSRSPQLRRISIVDDAANSAHREMKYHRIWETAHEHENVQGEAQSAARYRREMSPRIKEPSRGQCDKRARNIPSVAVLRCRLPPLPGLSYRSRALRFCSVSSRLCSESCAYGRKFMLVISVIMHDGVHVICTCLSTLYTFLHLALEVQHAA